MSECGTARGRRLRLWLTLGTGVLLLVALAAAGAGANGIPASPLKAADEAGPAAPQSPYTTSVTYLPFIAQNYWSGPNLFGIELPIMALDIPQAALSRTVETRAYFARWRFPWAYIEPISTTPPTYNLPNWDASVLAATRANLHLVLTVDANPTWASLYASGPLSATGKARFPAFVQAAVERYDGDGNADAPYSPVVNYWEFYNEPDGSNEVSAEKGRGSYWGVNGDDYADMLCTAYQAVKTANPHAQVLFGGIAHDYFDDENNPPGSFHRAFVDTVLTRIQIAYSGQTCFDLFNFHYYPAFRAAWDPYGPGLVGKMNYLRAKLQQHGMGNVPVAVTEMGWHSNVILENGQPRSDTGSPEMQAAYVPKLYAEAFAADPSLAIWFSWLDPGSTGYKNGLLYPDLQPKPAFHAYKVATGELQTAHYVRTLSATELGSNRLEGYLLARPASGTQQVYVLWSNDPFTSTTVYDVSLNAARVRLVDLYGAAVRIVNDADDHALDGRVTVPVDVRPIYVEVPP